jgi:hypothetical protein
MKRSNTRTKILPLAVALVLGGLNLGPTHAMGFFDTAQHEALPPEANDTSTASKTNELIKSAESEKLIEPATVELSDRITRVIDTLDDGISMRQYSFTSIRGQKVMIFNMKTKAQGPEWNVEYKINEEWVQVPTGRSFISSDLAPDQKVLMRVSRSVGMPVVAGDYYVIEFGSAPYIQRKRTQISGDYQWFLAYFHDHLFKHNLSWRTSVADSKGHPLGGAVVHFVLNRDEHDPYKVMTKEYVTDASGVVSGAMRFDECIGKYRTPPFTGLSDALTKWQATYNTGHWSFSVRGNDISDIKNSPLTQLCTSNMVQ